MPNPPPSSLLGDNEMAKDTCASIRYTCGESKRLSVVENEAALGIHSQHHLQFSGRVEPALLFCQGDGEAEVFLSQYPYVHSSRGLRCREDDNPINISLSRSDRDSSHHPTEALVV